MGHVANARLWTLRDLRRLGSCVMALSAMVGALALSGGPPAGAAGNGPLAKQILTEPVPGWLALPAADLDPTIADLQRVESAAAKITGMSAVVAGNGWISSHAQVLEIVLVAFVGKPLDATITRDLQVATKVGAETLCEGATTDPPSALRSIASPPGYLSTCHEVDGKAFKGVVFEKANMLGLVVSTVGSPELVHVSVDQYETIPAAGFDQPPSRPSPPSPGAIGATETVTTAGKVYAVRLTAVIDPAQPATPAVTAPKKGDRFVAVHLRITDTGATAVSGDANDAATVIGSNDQAYTPAIVTISGCTNFDFGSFQLSHGQAISGCVAFQLPDGVGVSTVKWSPTDGVGGAGEGAEWSA
ncbi:MAG TPA: hypothetical protein VMD28_10380 [Acidimicrobiales bacterium]|nr:hypothetical protein [Acidimicrobiales bacterium]